MAGWSPESAQDRRAQPDTPAGDAEIPDLGTMFSSDAWRVGDTARSQGDHRAAPGVCSSQESCSILDCAFATAQALPGIVACPPPRQWRDLAALDEDGARPCPH